MNLFDATERSAWPLHRDRPSGNHLRCPTMPTIVSSVECLFCRIVAGEIPSTIVYESDLSVAFRDLNPTAPTHVLVVPKVHIDHAAAITAADAESVADLFVTAQHVARADGIDGTGFRLVFNVGEDSGNTVNHLHLHVVGGRSMGWPPFSG